MNQNSADPNRDQFVQDRDCAFQDSLNCYKDIDTWLLKLSTGAFIGVAVTDQLSDSMTDSIFGTLSLALFAASICMSLWCKIYAYNTLQHFRDMLDNVYRESPCEYMSKIDMKAEDFLSSRHAFQDDLLRCTVSLVILAVGSITLAFLFN
ncbi:MAG: hypothetical protein ACF8MF_05175 [Phycisphaerales bacterium JB052]